MFIGKFKINIASFLLSMCLFFAPSWLHGAEKIDLKIYEDNRIIIKKVTNGKELDAFGKDESVKDHEERLSYPLDGPFGVYIAYEPKSMKPVGLKSFCHGFNKDGSLVAHPSINIIEKYQGNGYGTFLNIETLNYISQFFNQKVKMDNEKLSDLALSGVESSCEWFFGENLAALKSAIKAGYGIYAIGHFGTISMRYPNPNDGTLWDPNRVESILKFSQIMMKPSLDLVEKAVGYMATDCVFWLSYHICLRCLQIKGFKA